MGEQQIHLEFYYMEVEFTTCWVFGRLMAHGGAMPSTLAHDDFTEWFYSVASCPEMPRDP